MPPFRFHLQSVLNYRAQLEDQAKLALAGAKGKYERQRCEVERLEGELKQAFKRRHEPAKANRDEAWLLENYCKGLAEDLEQAQALLRHLAVEMEKARQKLVQAVQDRSLLAKLKERHYERHLKEENLQELRFNDEITTLRPRPAPF